MKKQKNKKIERKFMILWIIAAVLLFVIGGIIDVYFFRDSERIIRDVNPNTIELSANGKDFAEVYVINGSIDADIIDRDADTEIQLLRTSLGEINEKETLTLIGEPELGKLVAYQIPKNNSNYIYAVAEYLEDKGFETKVTHSEYTLKPGKLLWFECLNEYDEIDSDLQNANYCENDSDCKTLPLASIYIEFGCYHYINKKENSTDFYQRMNYYYAECGNIIDLCRMSPEPKCSNGKCIEAEGL